MRKVTQQETIAYRDQFYGPDNATLVRVGDLDPDKVMPLVTTYFGAIKAPYIEKRVIGRAATTPADNSPHQRVLLSW